jgi:hypothetical protein
MTLYTFSRNKGTHDNGGGSGWSHAGKQKYEELYKAVKKDRKTQSPMFNQELLKMYQSRRKMETGRTGNGQMKDGLNNRKKVAYRCINELNDSDDDSDDEEDQDKDDNHNQQATVVYKNQAFFDMDGTQIKKESV